MYESVLRNEEILQRLQERGRRDNSLWPKPLHLGPDDFALLKHVTSILEPVRAATNILSLNTSSLGDVIPIFTSTVDAVNLMEVTSDALQLKSYLLSALTDRIKMLLGTERALPCINGTRFSNVTPTEFALAAILNPRFCNAVENSYGFGERVIIAELERLYEIHFSEVENSDITSRISNTPRNRSDSTTQPKQSRMLGLRVSLAIHQIVVLSL